MPALYRQCRLIVGTLLAGATAVSFAATEPMFEAMSDWMSDPVSDARSPDAHPQSAPPAARATASVESMIVVRSSPLAGFQFHAGEDLWQAIRVGDPLTLVREPDNPHDPQAIRVDWRGIKLGYVPRRDNRQVARQIDLGAALEARISRLREARNPWDRIEFEVVLVIPR